MAIIQIGNFANVIDPGDGTLVVTRHSIMGKVASHTIISRHTAEEVAHWLEYRAHGKAPLVQVAFPHMLSEDREFLISGITPDEWNRMFPKKMRKGEK